MKSIACGRVPTHVVVRGTPPAAVPPPAPPPPLAEAPDKHVVARVVDRDTGAPIGGAAYEVRSGGAAIASGTTGRDGLIVKAVKPGSYAVALTRIEFAKELPPPREVPAQPRPAADGASVIEVALSGEVTAARWSKLSALVGEEVELTADIRGRLDGPLAFAIHERDEGGEDDFVERVTPEVEGERARFTWKVKHVDDADDPKAAAELERKGYTLPEFYFAAEVGGKPVRDSGKEEARLLRVTDVIDVVMKDELTGEPIPGARYELTLEGGAKREGVLDEESRLHEENVPPGRYWIRLLTEDPVAFAPGEAVFAARIDAMLPFGEGGAAAAPRGPELPLEVSLVTARPRLVEAGKEVELTAHLENAKGGEEVRFTVIDLSRPGAPAAELSARASGGKATVRWTARLAAGGALFADFDVEARSFTAAYASPGIPEFRAFTREG